MTNKPSEKQDEAHRAVSIPVSILKNQPKQIDTQSSIEIQPDALENSIQIEIDSSEQMLDDDVAKQPNYRWLLIAIVFTTFLSVGQIGVDLSTEIQQGEWFSLAWSVLWLMGIGGILRLILKEWRTIRALRRTEKSRDKADMLAVDHGQHDAIEFCKQLAKDLKISHASAYEQWLLQIESHHTNAEVMQLFNQLVLKDLDDEALSLVMNNSAKTALMVAASPLALADMVLVLWRSLKMIRQIATLYQIKLSYWSLIALMRQILKHMVFAGTTELATELGSDWFASELTTKVSAKLAQGLGAGLLSARLGLQAMQQCRPLRMSKQDKPTLSKIRKTLLGELTSTMATLFKESLSTQKVKAQNQEK